MPPIFAREPGDNVHHRYGLDQGTSMLKSKTVQSQHCCTTLPLASFGPRIHRPTKMLRCGRLVHRQLTSRWSCVGSISYRHFSVELLEIKMPALSPTMESGRIAEWIKKVGDPIAAGDTMAQVETDKATVAFDSTEEGFLAAILKPAGDAEVTVGEVIGYMVEEQAQLAGAAEAVKKLVSSAPAAAAAAAPAAASAKAPATPAASAAPTAGAKTAILSPAVAHLLRSHKLDYTQVAPTGRGGRILKGDVLALLAGGVIPPSTAAKAAAPAAAKAAAAAPAAAPVDGLQEDAIPQRTVGRGRRTFQDIKPSSMRKVIAKRLTESKTGVPHSYSAITCRLDTLLAMRKQYKDRSGASVNDYVIKAAAKALQDVPEANCLYDEKLQEAVLSTTVDISVAVAIPEGLITPIVKNADTLSLNQINSKVKELAEKAKSGKLMPEEFQGGSFTISNLGMFGVREFSAVINPPQSCILAIGGPQSKLTVNPETGEYEAVTTATITLSADRRVLDEEAGARYLSAFQKYLEDPELMML
eukprot:g80351.t1